jgi:hypothetical protein
VLYPPPFPESKGGRLAGTEGAGRGRLVAVEQVWCGATSGGHAALLLYRSNLDSTFQSEVLESRMAAQLPGPPRLSAPEEEGPAPRGEVGRGGKGELAEQMRRDCKEGGEGGVGTGGPVVRP